MMREAVISLNQIRAFTRDVELSFENRSDCDATPIYMLDANVYWFLKAYAGEDDRNIKDYLSDSIGADNASVLIRVAIQTLASSRGRLRMLEPHKYEADLTFAASLDYDYDQARESTITTLRYLMERHVVSGRGGMRDLVSDLKFRHPLEYRFLTDVFASRNRRDEFTRMIETVPVIRSSALLPELEGTLEKIRIILRAGYHRPAFSIRHDIEVLRSIAINNATRKAHRQILVTFDKKLLLAVRLVKLWGEPWSDLLRIESCQAFWVWQLTDPDIVKSSAAIALNEVMNDFRRKSRRLLGDLATNRIDDPVSYIDHLDRLKKLYEDISTVGANDPAFRFAEVQGVTLRLSAMLKAAQIENEGTDEDIITLQNAYAAFFREVRNIVPSFQIMISNEINRDTTLETALRATSMSINDFISNLDDAVQQHARSSLQILGTSSLVAPRVIRAIQAFASDGTTPSADRLVNRLPMPILSDQFDVRNIVALVTNEVTDTQVRYDRLLHAGSWGGLISDLITAYLQACGGNWAAAEEICEGFLGRDSGLIKSSEQYEAYLLAAGIFRIHKTSPLKLARAGHLLVALESCKIKRPSGDQGDFRVRLEQVAVRLNAALLHQYNSQTVLSGLNNFGKFFEDIGMCRELVSLHKQIGLRGDLAIEVRKKLNANITANLCLLNHFQTMAVVQKDYELSKSMLCESYGRITGGAARVSNFEVIVVGSTILKLFNELGLDRDDELSLAATVRGRLSVVLQRRALTNDFEYQLYRSILEEMHGMGF